MCNFELGYCSLSVVSCSRVWLLGGFAFLTFGRFAPFFCWPWTRQHPKLPEMIPSSSYKPTLVLFLGLMDGWYILCVCFFFVVQTWLYHTHLRWLRTRTLAIISMQSFLIIPAWNRLGPIKIYGETRELYAQKAKNCHTWLISSLANFKLPYTINLFLPARLSSSMWVTGLGPLQGSLMPTSCRSLAWMTSTWDWRSLISQLMGKTDVRVAK